MKVLSLEKENESFSYSIIKNILLVAKNTEDIKKLIDESK